MPLLMGFHGYGENARLHLEQLQRIPGTAQWLVSAVQALHPFYNSKSGEVAASWMTKFDRELAIEDNVRYIHSVVAQILNEHGRIGCLVYAGFSQGVAMAYRAAAFAGQPCHGLLLLAGDVPPEVKRDSSVRLPPILVGRGCRDEWYTQEKMDSDIEFLHSRSGHVQTLVFEGGHEWTEDFFLEAGRFLQWIVSPHQT